MNECRHETSRWGRCADCGMTWEQQAGVQRARNRIAELLAKHRGSSTRNLTTGEYKNPVREGYDRGLADALAVLDTIIGRGN